MFSEEKTRISPEQMKKSGDGKRGGGGGVDRCCEFSSAELTECKSQLCRTQTFAKEFHILPGKPASKPLRRAVGVYSGENPQCF